jgi:methyl-accepting chemotaxis protein
MFNKYSLKIALSIIVAGVFVIVAFIGYNYQSLTSSAYVVLYLLIVFIFLFGFTAGQNITMPLTKLLETADSFSKGDLKRRLDLKSTDEIGQLTKIFNTIAEQFEKQNIEHENSKISADIKAKTRILILEEVVSALDKKIKNRTLEFQKLIDEIEKLKQQIAIKDREVMDLQNKIARKK